MYCIQQIYPLVQIIYGSIFPTTRYNSVNKKSKSVRFSNEIQTFITSPNINIIAR